MYKFVCTSILLFFFFSCSSEKSSEISQRDTRKGDKIQVRTIVQGKELTSHIIEIKNTPPEITRVKIVPEIFKPGDALSVEVSGNDADNDEITFAYEWTKNGEPVGNSKYLEVPVKRGDKISVKITPFDGEVNGKAVILKREIKNIPPMIVEDKNIRFEGNLYMHQIKATDPDGDVLTYSLKVAPADMIINSSTGLIQWDTPQDLNKKIPITVSVTDGNGGETSQSFTLEITAKARS